MSVTWRLGTLSEANSLLREAHYLGPMRSGGRLITVGELDGQIVAAQVWRLPTTRRLPCDGTWLELSRWCLTPAAGENAGSRSHAHAARLMKPLGVRTLVSYSDPSHGHTGALYRACNWRWAPTWLRLRPPPTGNGNWGDPQGRQAVKDRWVFHVTKADPARVLLPTDDRAAVRWWLRNGVPHERRWAELSGYVPFIDELTEAAA